MIVINRKHGNTAPKQKGSLPGLTFCLMLAAAIMLATMALSPIAAHAATDADQSSMYNVGTPLPLSGPTPPATNYFTHAIKDILYPLQYIAGYVAIIMGLFVMGIAIHRLKSHHASPGKQLSPLATGMHLIAGMFLINYSGTIQMLGQSVFGYLYTNKNGDQMFTNVMSYVTQSTNTSSGSMVDFTNLIYALLLLVGLLSFIRGSFLLIKIGEGSTGGESAHAKSITHLCAGIIGINTHAVVNMITYMGGSTGLGLF